jgi:hypothetical protein
MSLSGGGSLADESIGTVSQGRALHLRPDGKDNDLGPPLKRTQIGEQNLMPAFFSDCP